MNIGFHVMKMGIIKRIDILKQVVAELETKIKVIL
jgi:hypothetical protein